MPATTKRPTRRILGRLHGALLVALPSGKGGEDVYAVKRIRADWGAGFAWLKAGTTEPYHVMVDGAAGSSCDCQGCLQWAHCKHLDASKALIAQGKL